MVCLSVGSRELGGFRFQLYYAQVAVTAALITNLWRKVKAICCPTGGRSDPKAAGMIRRISFLEKGLVVHNTGAKYSRLNLSL